VWNRKNANQESLAPKEDQECLEPQRTIERPGESETEKDRESLEPLEIRPGESGTGKEVIRRVWNRKGADQESLEPERSRPGESGTEKEQTRRVWNRKRAD
jgi:hypothetical protein